MSESESRGGDVPRPPDDAPAHLGIGRTPTKSTLVPAWLQSHGTVRIGLAALSPRRNPALFVYMVFGMALAVIATVGPAVPVVAAWLEGFGFGGPNSGKLVLAAAIFDGVLLVGSWRLATGLGFLARERLALDQIETRCTQYLARLDVLRIDLTAPENPFVFGGTARDPKLVATAAYKMTENVRLDAAGRRFDPVNLIVERVLGNVTAHSTGLRDAQQFGVRLGILATFIGIVGSLAGVGPIVRATNLDNSMIQESINLIVGSLGIAFSTSIAGLAAAILLQLMAWTMRSRENDLVELLERQAGRVQIVCRRASEDTPLGEDIAALRSVLGEHVDFMRRQEKDMIAISSRFGDALSRTENTLAQPIAALEQSGRRLSDLLATQSAAITGLERMTAAVGELETRVVAQFEAASTRGVEVQKAALADMSEVLRTGSTRLVEEIRSGWGVESREAIETLVDRRLGEAAGRLVEAAPHQREAVNRLARRLALAMVFAAAAMVLVTAQTAGLPGWLAARLTSG